MGLVSMPKTCTGFVGLHMLRPDGKHVERLPMRCTAFSVVQIFLPPGRNYTLFQRLAI